MSNCPSSECELFVGKKSEEIEKIINFNNNDPVITKITLLFFEILSLLLSLQWNQNRQDTA